MAIKTGDQYLKSLEALKIEAHVLGKKTQEPGSHGLIGPSRQAVAFTYDAAHSPESREMLRADFATVQQ